jgi:poly(3-hydroxybutyrate) depolymerase
MYAYEHTPGPGLICINVQTLPSVTMAGQLLSLINQPGECFMNHSVKPMLRVMLMCCAVLALHAGPASAQLIGPVSAQHAVKLPSYGADPSQISVSGLSSGAFMAAQFQVAYSASVMGAGIVAGGPFYCSGSLPMMGYVTTAMTLCGNPLFGVGPDAATLLTAAKTFAAFSQIDDTANLSKQRFYVFSGTDDQVVNASVVDQTVRFFKLAGIPAKNINYVNKVKAGHAFITPNRSDTACALTRDPYINNCDIDQAKDILTQIYGKLAPPVTALTGKLIAFDQNAFSSSAGTSLADTAYLYVPASCETTSCRVHVAFHGCEQGATTVGDKFYGTTGYNQVADSNNVIMLYPQVQPSQMAPMNPKGCWDFWGYSTPLGMTPNFYSRSAPQMAAVKAMLERLAQPRQQALAAAGGQ